MRIMGIDPGTRHVGYGVVDERAGNLSFVACGVIEGGAGAVPKRLLNIYNALSRIVKAKRPNHAAVERVFMGVNADTTIKIGEGRSIAILCAVQGGAQLFEYAPSQIKKAVTGNGRASKEMVAEMVRHILNISGKEMVADASDALAIAICHSFRKD